MGLFIYAFCFNYDKKIAGLASLSPEKWSFGNNKNYEILKKYIDQTFLILEKENGILEDDQFALFNTGLYTPYYEPIMGYFTLNPNKGKQKWFLDGFYSSYQLSIMGVVGSPPRVNYFAKPEDFIFDVNCGIMPHYQHVFNGVDNYPLIPEVVRESQNQEMIFSSAIDRAKHMIRANYKTAVPQYSNGRIRLLIPIYLVSASQPDFALAISKNEAGNQYLGHTCLSLQTAYMSARLIARPDSTWLTP